METRNCWRCEKCDFYVFNSKKKCKKCLSDKPVQVCNYANNTPYNNILKNSDKETQEHYHKIYLESEVSCSRCRSEGRVYNKDPLISNHNCWKYS